MATLYQTTKYVDRHEITTGVGTGEVKEEKHTHTHKKAHEIGRSA